MGVRALLNIVETRYPREEFLKALRTVKVAARGPKPVAALRELNVPVTVTAGEPMTWHELMSAMDAEFGDALSEFRVAVQEYGASNPEFLAELTLKCAEVTKVPVYQWALPEDIRPLRECVLGIASGNIDVILFMTAVQVIHLFQVAEQMGCEDDLRAGLASIVVISIGPTTSEELAHYGVLADFEPSRPKMGFVVNEAAQYSRKVLERKRVGKTKAEDQPDAKASKARPVARIETKAETKNVRRVQPSTPTMAGFRDGLTSIDFLHEISSRIAAADSFPPCCAGQHC